MEKESVRQTLKIKRRYFGEIKKIHADGCITDIFLQAFGGYDSFFIYRSTKFEVETRRIISALLSAGKSVFVPRVEGNNMVAVKIAEGENYKISPFGIEEPEGQASCDMAQVCVIPLLAVNERRFRLGYGGGYYDRYLKDKNIVKVGLGYAFQVCEFKEEAHDIPIDYFISEKGNYKLCQEYLILRRKRRGKNF